MNVFIDTSAFYAVFDRDDANHAAADAVWTELLGDSAVLLTTNYVLLETTALLQNRIGIPAVRDFHEHVIPLLHVEWIDAETHRSGTEAVLAAARRKLSLVDCVSFQTMRKLGVREAFCFDGHFAEQGFDVLPKVAE